MAGMTEQQLRLAALSLRKVNTVLTTGMERIKDTLLPGRARCRRLAKQSDQLREQVGKLSARVGTLADANSRLRARNADLQDKLSTRVGALADANSRLRARNADLQELRARSADLQDKLSALRGRLVLLAHERTVDHRSGKLDPIDDNTASGMDRLYANADGLGRYASEFCREFAGALRHFLQAEGVAIDGMAVGDFGCGTASVLQHLLEGTTPTKIVGFDHSPAALQIAREALPQADFVCRDICEPLGTTFDLVLCIETIEHLRLPRLGLSAILTSVAAGGAALVTVPDGRSDVSLWHINFWSPESWPVFISETIESMGEARRLDYRTGTLEIDQARIPYNYALIRRTA